MPDSTLTPTAESAAPHQPAAWRAFPAGEASSRDATEPPGPDTPREARLAAIKSAKVPLLEAAQPLLRALADMPKSLDLPQINVFHRLLLREVTSFQSLCNDAQIRHEHMVAASYALCTAIDEAAGSTVWGGGQGAEAGAWASRQLAVHFHEDNKGGDKVFLLIGRLTAQPQEHIDLLDLMFFILAMGFEGRYRNATNGRRDLETIRRRLYEIVRSARGDVPGELSLHWRGVGTGAFKLAYTVPLWLTASLLSLALLAQFGWYKYDLAQRTESVVQGVLAVGAMRPPAVVLKPLRLKELLAAEIAAGTVSVDEDSANTAINFKGDEMFVAGQARLNAKILPVIAIVAREVAEVSGVVRVTGHSDNQPIRTAEFPNNQALSEKRAAAVAEMLRNNGVAAERLQVLGQGDTQPVADSTTAAGRARNRRVEVVVMQGVDSGTPFPGKQVPVGAPTPASNTSPEPAPTPKPAHAARAASTPPAVARVPSTPQSGRQITPTSSKTPA